MNKGVPFKYFAGLLVFTVFLGILLINEFFMPREQIPTELIKLQCEEPGF